MSEIQKLVPIRAKDEAAPKWVQEKVNLPEPTTQESADVFPMQPATPDIGDGENIPY